MGMFGRDLLWETDGMRSLENFESICRHYMGGLFRAALGNVINEDHFFHVSPFFLFCLKQLHNTSSVLISFNHSII